MTDWTAVGLGTAATVAGTLLATVVTLPEAVRAAGILLLLSLGFLGGALAGGLCGGGPRRGLRHGLASGAGGGLVFGAVSWLALSEPGAATGVFHSAKYALATSGLIPSEIVVRHGAALQVALAALGAALFAVEGAVAGGASAESTVVEPVEP